MDMITMFFEGYSSQGWYELWLSLSLAIFTFSIVIKIKSHLGFS